MEIWALVLKGAAKVLVSKCQTFGNYKALSPSKSFHRKQQYQHLEDFLDLDGIVSMSTCLSQRKFSESFELALKFD